MHFFCFLIELQFLCRTTFYTLFHMLIIRNFIDRRIDSQGLRIILSRKKDPNKKSAFGDYCLQKRFNLTPITTIRYIKSLISFDHNHLLRRGIGFRIQLIVQHSCRIQIRSDQLHLVVALIDLTLCNFQHLTCYGINAQGCLRSFRQVESNRRLACVRVWSVLIQSKSVFTCSVESQTYVFQSVSSIRFNWSYTAVQTQFISQLNRTLRFQYDREQYFVRRQVHRISFTPARGNHTRSIPVVVVLSDIQCTRFDRFYIYLILQVRQRILHTHHFMEVRRGHIYTVRLTRLQLLVSYGQRQLTCRASAASCRISRQVDITDLHANPVNIYITTQIRYFIHFFICTLVKESPACVVRQLHIRPHHQLAQLQYVKCIDPAISIHVRSDSLILTLQQFFL